MGKESTNYEEGKQKFRTYYNNKESNESKGKGDRNLSGKNIHIHNTIYSLNIFDQKHLKF